MPFWPWETLVLSVELREPRHLRSIRLALLAQDKFLDLRLAIANRVQVLSTQRLPRRDGGIGIRLHRQLPGDTAPHTAAGCDLPRTVRARDCDCVHPIRARDPE